MQISSSPFPPENDDSDRDCLTQRARGVKVCKALGRVWYRLRAPNTLASIITLVVTPVWVPSARESYSPGSRGGSRESMGTDWPGSEHLGAPGELSSWCVWAGFGEEASGSSSSSPGAWALPGPHRPFMRWGLGQQPTPDAEHAQREESKDVQDGTSLGKPPRV